MRLNLLLAIFIGFLVFLQYRLWFEDGGMRESMLLKSKLLSQLEENKALKHQNDELFLEIRRLREHSDATEDRARNELGMIKKGEKFYQVVK